MNKYFLIPLIISSLLFNKGFSFKKSVSDKIVSFFMFVPEKELKKTPSDFNLIYEEIEISLDKKNKICGWHIPAEKPTKKTIIYLHGAKGNLSNYLHNLSKLHRTGADILTFDYRGFGMSKGMETIKHSIDDAETMYDYLVKHKKVKPEDISLYGFSFGGAVALELAMKREVNAIVLESTFSDLNRLSVRKYSCFVAPLVSKNLLTSDENIKKIKVPIIISYAGNDQVIPIEHSMRLFEVANEPKFLFQIKNAQHQNIPEYITPEYISLIKQVLIDGIPKTGIAKDKSHIPSS
ncbi:MAG: hypothetical protein A3B68_07580 [Candidatus Melainabacteria bacterium RIFCSPHIGHO2_02_FULL_34_12]|nr:MAG: hypothetical protein A3B68_07580 [Candidatus Melainabacteria bacterium RIFCSPHIGHO2_02_FULL_34_12]